VVWCCLCALALRMARKGRKKKKGKGGCITSPRASTGNQARRQPQGSPNGATCVRSPRTTCTPLASYVLLCEGHNFVCTSSHEEVGLLLHSSFIFNRQTPRRLHSLTPTTQPVPSHSTRPEACSLLSLSAPLAFRPFALLACYELATAETRSPPPQPSQQCSTTYYFPVTTC